MDIEKNHAIIVPTTQNTTTSSKPLGSATRFDWVKFPQHAGQHISGSESRSSQIRRNSLSQRNLSRKAKLCFRLADLVMVMCLIFPLTIAFWRGIWQLMEYHSKQWGIDPWLSMGVGYSIPFVLHLFQEPLQRHVSLEKMSFPRFYILTRTILLIHSFGSVNQWRGLWAWMDRDLGIEAWSAAAMMIIGIFVSVVLKTLNNVLAPPLFCVVDESKSIHDCPLRFKTLPNKRVQYFLDCVFSVIIVPAFVVFCWRGLWTLADIYLFPENETNSAMASLSLGYAVCIGLCLGQPWICKRAQNLKGFVRLLFMDTIYIIGFVGCVLAWRGVWNSYNIFFVFEIQNVSEWITTIIGALGTMILGCISSVVVRGIAIDGDLVEDGSAEWLIPYISVVNSPVYDVPYPEPWLCRYFCTSQKIGGKGSRLSMKDCKTTSALDKNLTKPLTIGKNLTHSVHSTDPSTTDQDYMNKNVLPRPQTKNYRFRLSDLPNIDSSSEEELGMRTTMIPLPDDGNNDNRNSGTDEQDGSLRQAI